LGPYEVQALAGAGGMGEVYRARDTRLDRTVAVKLLPAPFASDPEASTQYLSSPCVDAGFLLSTDFGSTVLRARAFHPEAPSLLGSPIDVLDLGSTGAPSAIAAGGGTLAILDRAVSDARLTWFDRNGARLGTLSDPVSFCTVELSPDGRQFVVDQFEAGASGDQDLWIGQADRPGLTRVTVGAGDQRGPVWHPDGRRLFYYTPKGIAMQRLNSVEPERIVFSGPGMFPKDVSPDGRLLLTETRGRARDLMVGNADGTGSLTPVADARADESGGQFSPDGRWIAYVSNESGRYEVYLQPFPATGGRRQISIAGGAQPRWRKDGRELFFLTLQGVLMSAAMTLGNDVTIEPPREVFDTGIGMTTGSLFTPRYDVTADGQRFLVTVPEAEQSSSIRVVLNWPALIAKQR
jgi:hypothetical protein